jgi:hypothetical protein
LSNYNKDDLLKCHLEILKHYPEEIKIIVVHMGAKHFEPTLDNCKVINIPDSGSSIRSLFALMKALEIAWEDGICKINYREGDQWTLNHERVKENFSKNAVFQAFHSKDGADLNNSYLDVERFTSTYEEFANWALFQERDASVEKKFNRWVQMSVKTAEESHKLENPEDYQIIGDQREIDRMANYQKIKNKITYLESLEKEPNFKKWLETSTELAKPEKIEKNDYNKNMNISVRFGHGLGDCCNFAHLIPLFTRRGYEISVHCDPDKTPIFIAAGAKIVNAAQNSHGWFHPHVGQMNSLDDHWNGSKAGHNINHSPMPFIGRDHERWQELCDERISLEDQSTQETKDFINEIIKDLPRPLILIHTKGNCSTEQKNLDDGVTTRLYELLLNNTDGTIILLDWDNRVPWSYTARIKKIKANFPNITLMQLYELMQSSDLLIGIDSGPLHFSRFTKIPTLGIWTKHYPSHFVLPHPNAVHLVPSFQNSDKFRRIYFNTVLSSEDKLTAEEITKQALRVLGPAKYIRNPEHKMRDVQLQNFIDRTARKGPKDDFFVDRNISFTKALSRLSSIENPQILETGCIRQEEDWDGAGFSTFIFGHFAHYNDGKLYSVDMDEENCKFAKKWIDQFGDAVSIYTSRSEEFLESFTQPIDLFYADSADEGTPNFEEICLREVQLIQKNMRENSMILIDDTREKIGSLVGKGKLAVPWLVENGWKVLYNSYQQLLVRAK